jgi:hypothetical protein
MLRKLHHTDVALNWTLTQTQSKHVIITKCFPQYFYILYNEFIKYLYLLYVNSQFVIKCFEDCISYNHSSKDIPLYLLKYNSIFPTTAYSHHKDERQPSYMYTATYCIHQQVSDL